MSETPASDAGLQVGDIVTAVDGAPIEGNADLVAVIAERRPGDAIVITDRRASVTRELTVTLGTQPENAPATS
jgi:putative serine protease PepD